MVYLQTVTHPGINRARRRVTPLIETNALPLSQAATIGGRREIKEKMPQLLDESIIIVCNCKSHKETACWDLTVCDGGTDWLWLCSVPSFSSSAVSRRRP